MKDVRIAFRVSSSLKKKLEKKAEKREITVSRLMRESVIEYYKKFKIKKIKEQEKGLV